VHECARACMFVYVLCVHVYAFVCTFMCVHACGHAVLYAHARLHENAYACFLCMCLRTSLRVGGWDLKLTLRAHESRRMHARLRACRPK